MRIPCKFCQRHYTPKDYIDVKRINGGWITFKNQHVNCQTCLVDFYYDYTDNSKLVRINYRIRSRPYSDVNMDLALNKTFLIFHPKQKTFSTSIIAFDGTWPETKPNDALALAKRLTNLLMFL